MCDPVDLHGRAVPRLNLGPARSLLGAKSGATIHRLIGSQRRAFVFIRREMVAGC